MHVVVVMIFLLMKPTKPQMSPLNARDFLNAGEGFSNQSNVTHYDGDSFAVEALGLTARFTSSKVDYVKCRTASLLNLIFMQWRSVFLLADLYVAFLQ